jgi:hypothetical protein
MEDKKDGSHRMQGRHEKFMQNFSRETRKGINHFGDLDVRKGKIVPVLFFNRASSHEGVLWEWRYSSTHS